MSNTAPLVVQQESGSSVDPAGITNAIADAIFYLDGEGRLLWANTAAEALFGRDLDDSIGMNALDFVHPEDQQVVALSMLSMQSKSVGSLLEVRIGTADGWRLVEVLGSRHRDGLVLSVRDLTTRRRWDISNGEIERGRSLVENSSSLTFLMDRAGCVIASTGATSRLLGLDQGVIEGLPFASIVHPDDHAAMEAVLAALLADPDQRRSSAVDLRLRGGDGGHVPFAVSFVDLLDDPTVEGIVATGHDVSDRVASESALRDAVSVLAATLESTADAVLVVDSTGHVTASNRRFAAMWGLEPAPDGSLDVDEVLVSVAGHLVDPDVVLRTLESFSGNEEAHSHDLVELTDGRIIEADSLPQYVGGAAVGRVWTFRDVTEERRLRDELSHQAFHDSLTGLANQALFRDRVTNSAARLERTGGELAVLFIDLDRFKAVNDRLGHAAGDELLVAISDRILGCLRAGDTAARVGGDEFAVLIDDLGSHSDAAAVAERIIGALGVPFPLSSGSLSSGASIGIAYGDRNTRVEDLLRNADLAMYAAKSGGRNRHSEFSPAMLDAAVDRIDLESDLRQALAREEIEIVYQPVVELPGSRIVAMEALLRWNHPERGMLAPAQFLSLGEATGQMGDLGRFVLEQSALDAARWASVAGGGSVAVSVNLSREQLMDPSLPSLVSDTIAMSGLRPDLLILETAESVVMADPEVATTQLESLVGLGVRVAIDDFGTGATSLAHLAGFPIDMLKIDGGFLRESLAESQRTVVEAVMLITASLGVIPVAEGVESAEQVEVLLAMGCHTMQGYYLSSPLSRAEASGLAAAGRLDHTLQF